MSKPRFFRRQNILRFLAGLLLLFLVIIVSWVAVAGPVTVFRVVRYGDSNIDDFSHYPGRALRPGENPVTFKRGERELTLSPGALSPFGFQGDLRTILADNDTIAFLVVQGDTILYEAYFQGHDAASISMLFSVSKSFTGMLIGMAIEDGYIGGVDQPITDFIPELSKAGFGPVTIRHLLTMTSGSNYQENDNPFGEHVILNYTPFLEREILEFTMERPPGEIWRYKSGDNALLGLALDRALGAETITDYAQRRVWGPVGMQDRGVWSIDREGDGLERTWCCLATSARDIAKVGALFRDQGYWNGEQVISADWVAQSTAQGQVPAEAWPDAYREIGWRNYGFQWWLASEAAGDYFALGKDGQFVYVNPDADVVIVRLGWSPGKLTSSKWIRIFQTIAGEAGP